MLATTVNVVIFATISCSKGKGLCILYVLCILCILYVLYVLCIFFGSVNFVFSNILHANICIFGKCSARFKSTITFP